MVRRKTGSGESGRRRRRRREKNTDAEVGNFLKTRVGEGIVSGEFNDKIERDT